MENLRQSATWVVLAMALLSSVQKISGQTLMSGTETRLFRDLFTGYNSESRPVRNGSSPVTVHFGLSLNQLLDLDERNQVLTTFVWIYEEWQDENMQWSPEDYDGLSTLRIPSTKVWTPDTFIFNIAGNNVDGFVNVTGSKLLVESEGSVKWMVPLMVKSSCAMDVTYFPYDRQRCELRFGSWIYDIHQVDMQLKPAEVDLSHFVMNSEFDVLNVTLTRRVDRTTGSCCPDGAEHVMISCHIHVSRKSLYYDYIVIAPTIMLSLLTLATFLLPCHKGEKIAIGLTVFLTLYVLQLRIAENVPDTNSTPILGIFMFLVMTFNCVSLIMATVVMNIKKRGEEQPCPDVPRWLLWLCHAVLSKVVFTKYLWQEQIIPTVPREPDRKSPRTSLHESDFSFSDNQSATSYDTSDESEAARGPVSMVLENPSAQEQIRLMDMRSRNRRVVNPRDRLSPVTQPMLSLDDHNTVVEQERARERREADVHLLRFSALNWNTLHMKRQWFFVAEVVDKFAFLLYLLTMIVSFFMVLYVVPQHMQKPIVTK